MAGVFMELIKKQIHMNQWKGNVATQITLDDDFIVPDTMDDMEQVMLDNGEIQAEQVKPMGDKVNVKGRLEFQVLYRREGGGLQTLGGSSGEYCTMGETLMQRRRVEEEGLRIVNSCC